MKFLNLVDRVKVILPILLCCVIVVFGIFGHSGVVPHFINSDTLQPAHMAWDMTRHDYAITQFQWSRVPSFPDVAFFFLMDWASIDVRVSFLLYTCLVATGAILALGWVVARLRGCNYGEGAFWAGIGVVAGLVALMAGIASSPDQALLWVPQSFLFICNFHGDAFLLSILASCAAVGAIRGDRRQAGLTWACCILGTASDTIFLGYFLLPITVASILVALRRGESALSLKAVARFLTVTALACLAGWLLKAPLPMQDMQVLFSSEDARGSSPFDSLTKAPWVVAILLLTLGLSIWATWAFRTPIDPAKPASGEADRELLILTGLGASVMSFGLTMLIYFDPSSYRYAIPFFWWPLAIGLGLVRVPCGATVRMIVAGAATLATVAVPLTASALPQWRTPLERCLSDNRARWNLKAGLATYWNSRSTMASSNWKLQVDQINNGGRAYFWGNNMVAYLHDMHAPHRPPEYNFIVLDRDMDTFELENMFGPAARSEICGDFGISIYDQPIIPPGIDDRPSRSFWRRVLPQ